MIDSVVITAARIVTFHNQRSVTHASGFSFQCSERLCRVSSGHVLVDAPSRHHPSGIALDLHTP